MKYKLNPITTNVLIIKKPVNWFARKIRGRIRGFYIRGILLVIRLKNWDKFVLLIMFRIYQ